MHDRQGHSFGRYEIKNRLREGGFAVTYSAEDPILGRTVELKIFKAEYGEDSHRFALNEARACVRLSHPNIQTLHDYVADVYGNGLVFEIVSGRSLESAGPSPVAVRVFADIARTLAYSHSKGVIHCDVKPRNLIIDDSGRAIVIDFGIAHMADFSIRREDEVMGTLQYIAPELLVGSDPTSAADVFGLALTLFECATGKHPFGHVGDPNQVLHNIMSMPPQIGILRESGVPERLIGIVDSALAKSPESRPSMTRLADELLTFGNASLLTRSPDDRTEDGSARAFAFEEPSAAAAGCLRVFMCHASDDKPAVRKLYRRLREDGFKPWLDEEDLVPGQDWVTEITREVRASDVVIVCLSSRTVRKQGFVQREIRMALDVADEMPEDKTYLIPAKLDTCDMPDRLRRWQWVDMFKEDGYKRLHRALALRANAR